MALLFHPQQGTLLMCDFSGFKAPEMVKKRPVVVISKRPRRHELYTVVPLSTTAPRPVEAYHHRMDPASMPGKLAEKEVWAKCDVIVTVGLHRLDRVKVRDPATGKRRYVAPKVTPNDLRSIQIGVLIALGFHHLTPYL